jgi:2-hydroxychromene-2-carboxylate isomerase
MTPEFLYDFGSPNAYLAWRVLPEIEERTGTRFRQIPVLLGGIFKETGNQSPFHTYANVRGRIAYEQREIERFLASHEIANFRFNPAFPQNSLQMMRGAVAAAEMDCLTAYTEACFRGMWEEGLKMDDSDVLHRRLEEAGLDATHIMTLSAEAKTKARLAESTNDAVARGVFGLPSFFIGDELFFGKDRLGQVEIEILRHKND